MAPVLDPQGSKRMTRLYYEDSYREHFTARVVESLDWEGSPAVVLDQTAFYPSSGGQPADRGVLGGVEVLDVAVRAADGAVVHVLERALPASNGEVEGALDWPRRFDHMQQHTGQHLLSAAFEQLLDGETVGFHLGAEASTVDIDVVRLEQADVVPVEDLVNRVVWEDRPVRVRLVTPAELAALSLRRQPAVEGDVRIVEVGGPGEPFDVNPCGGTHVARTGEIGLVKVTGLEHRGETTRVEFLCGRRALLDYRTKDTEITRLAATLTVGHWELDQAVERLQAEGKELRHDLRQARKLLVKVHAAELAEAAVVRGAHRVVWRVWEGCDPDELKALAQELARESDVVALLAGIEDGERTMLCFASGEEAGVDVASLLREACEHLGGRGGGRPHVAQGSAPVTDVGQVEAAIADLLPSLGPAASE